MIGPRYILREGSRGGERVLARSGDPAELLERRDKLRAGTSPRSLALDVLDLEAVDPPESGIVERCPACGHPILASRIDG